MLSRSFFSRNARAKAVQVVGACRRRVEVIEEIAFVIQTDDFPFVVRRLQRYGGRTELLEASADGAVYRPCCRHHLEAASLFFA